MKRYLAALVLGAAGILGAQESLKSSFDRTVVPKPAPDPVPKMPTWTKATLSNGAQLYVVERHALPLVYFSLNFVGGSNQLEPADKTGLGSLTASMMTEGTMMRSSPAGSSCSWVTTPICKPLRGGMRAPARACLTSKRCTNHSGSSPNCKLVRQLPAAISCRIAET